MLIVVQLRVYAFPYAYLPFRRGGGVSYAIFLLSFLKPYAVIYFSPQDSYALAAEGLLKVFTFSKSTPAAMFCAAKAYSVEVT